MRFKGETVFVTGGAGFIGSALIRHLLANTQANVVNIDKLTYAANLSSVPNTPTNRYRFEKVDIADGLALRWLFERDRPSCVVNLAAESHVDRSIDAPAEFVQTNVVGTFTLLQEALRHWNSLDQSQQRQFRLLHVSTDEVYGSLSDDNLFSETTPYAPNSPYAASKASSDHLVRAWRRTYGLPTIVTNCSNNYGPYQFPEKLIPHMIIRALADQPLPVYGTGTNRRDWLYVEDHARALTLVAEHGAVGETYNVGGRSERSNIDVVRTICQLLDALQPPHKGPREKLITFVPDRPGHDLRYAIDPSKIERNLNWHPTETFESGLLKTVRWYLDESTWWQTIIERGYSGNRIGLRAL